MSENELMTRKYLEQIGNDLKETGEHQLCMEWLGVWHEAWRACEHALAPSQLAADLETSRRGLADYRATIERMVKEKEELTARFATESAATTHWLKIGQERGYALQSIYQKLAVTEWASTRCPLCFQLTGKTALDGHKDDCLWIEANRAIGKISQPAPAKEGG